MATTDRVIAEDAVRVLDHGFVRLDGAMATDLSVVNAARVSFARRKEEMEEADEGLIRFLMRDRHGTPFEHNAFRFHIRAPIFVAREWFRHRIGSFNEFSMRYARATDDFYVPEADDVVGVSASVGVVFAVGRGGEVVPALDLVEEPAGPRVRRLVRGARRRSGCSGRLPRTRTCPTGRHRHRGDCSAVPCRTA